MSVPAARELVGRPFLRDDELASHLDGVGGTVDLIACHRGGTETQAVNMLGFPDATIVTPSFGVYVAGDVQKVQLALLANCRDEQTTQYATQRFFDWLVQSGESTLLAKRAIGRAAFARAITAPAEPQGVARGANR
jgi:hypothetical protein